MNIYCFISNSTYDKFWRFEIDSMSYYNKFVFNVELLKLIDNI